MSINDDRLAGMPGAVAAALRMARRVGSLISECNEAQRRLITLWLAPDRYAVDSDRAPDTYAEFLFRTSGWLRHEPAACDRAAD
jgi:hypothetical protein